MTLTELKAIAKKATPGPWKLVWHGNEKYPFPLSVLTDDGCTWIARDGATSTEANAQYIAAFNPATALKLIEALSVAREALEDISSKTPACDGGTCPTVSLVEYYHYEARAALERLRELGVK